MSIIDLFDRGCAIRSEGDYLISWDQRHTCRDAQVSTYQVANGLRWLGVESNAKAAVLAGNDPLAWPCVLSIWRAVMVWVPLKSTEPAEGERGARRDLRRRGAVLPAGLRGDGRGPPRALPRASAHLPR